MKVPTKAEVKQQVSVLDALCKLTAQTLTDTQIELLRLQAEIESFRKDARKLLITLKEARSALETANDCGIINDTIWMHGRPETLFDYLDAAIAAEGEK